MRFRTKSGSIYVLDTVNKLFYGGKFKNPMSYVQAQVIIGCKALIQLSDGRLVRTSIVECYL